MNLKRINRDEYQLQTCYANTMITDNASNSPQMTKRDSKSITPILPKI